MSSIQEYLKQHISTKEIKEITREYTLTDGSSVTVRDYSPIGNDDDFYNKHGYDTMLKRGTVCIHYHGREYWFYGLPKFGYDNQATGVKTTPETVWYFTEKENGECGHIAFLDKNHIVIGSKNVHIVFCIARYAEDLAMYKHMYEAHKETRLEYAIRIADLLKEQKWNEGLKEYMSNNNIVMIVEAIFNNHIVYYTSTGYRVTSFTQDGQVLPFQVTMQLCSLYQLPLVDTEAATTEEEYRALERKYVHANRDCEGAVIYKDTGMGTIEMYKLKHPVYVAKRAARELIKRRASKQQWDDRMNQLHVTVPHLLLDDLFNFYLWILKTVPHYTRDDVQDQFAILWKEYTEKTPVSYVAEMHQLLPDHRNDKAKVIGFVGIPGCGKSTLSKAVEGYLKHIGKNVVRVNQDEMCKNRKQFIHKLSELSKTWDGYILVDKANHTTYLRNDVESLFKHVTWIMYADANMVETCLSRIRARGIHHPSLVYSYKTQEVVKRFFSELVPPQGLNVHPVNMQDPLENQLQCVLQCENIPYDANYIIPNVERPKPVNIMYWKIEFENGKHVTLIYQPTPQDNARLEPFFGQEVSVEVEYILRTPEVHVAKVRSTPFLQEFCQNAYPHITLWTAEGVKPFTSNQILEQDAGEKEHCNGVVYKGIITVVLK